jgi:hypothetical protein
MIKIVSANRLNDGTVVYMGLGGAWMTRIADASRLESAEAVEAALVAARADEALNLIIDAFVVDAIVEAEGVRATTLRDRIRADGPTIAYGAPAESSRAA